MLFFPSRMAQTSQPSDHSFTFNRNNMFHEIKSKGHFEITPARLSSAFISSGKWALKTLKKLGNTENGTKLAPSNREPRVSSRSIQPANMAPAKTELEDIIDSDIDLAIASVSLTAFFHYEIYINIFFSKQALPDLYRAKSRRSVRECRNVGDQICQQAFNRNAICRQTVAANFTKSIINQTSTKAPCCKSRRSSMEPSSIINIECSDFSLLSASTSNDVLRVSPTTLKRRSFIAIADI